MPGLEDPASSSGTQIHTQAEYLFNTHTKTKLGKVSNKSKKFFKKFPFICCVCVLAAHVTHHSVNVAVTASWRVKLARQVSQLVALSTKPSPRLDILF